MEIVYLFMSKYFIAIIVHESSAKTPDIHTGSIRMKKKEEDKKKTAFSSFSACYLVTLLYGYGSHSLIIIWLYPAFISLFVGSNCTKIKKMYKIYKKYNRNENKK